MEVFNLKCTILPELIFLAGRLETLNLATLHHKLQSSARKHQRPTNLEIAACFQIFFLPREASIGRARLSPDSCTNFFLLKLASVLSQFFEDPIQ